MKKVFLSFLCLVFVVLYACGQAMQEESTAVLSERVAQESDTETIIAGKTIEDTVTNRYGQPIVEVKTNEKDPYSHIIKELNDKLNDDDADVYHLTQFYSLYDIDGNGTKELLISEGGNLLAVSTIQNGVAVWQEVFSFPLGEGGRILPSLVFRNGTIRTDNNVDGELDYIYYRFEDGELNFKTLLSDRFGSNYRMYVQFGPISPITKAEFDRLQKEFEGDGQLVELDWKPLAEYGR